MRKASYQIQYGKDRKIAGVKSDLYKLNKKYQHAFLNAAKRDEQISEGKSLSEREEAVLQALELLTHDATGVVWVKSSTLRERVAGLIGQSEEKMGDAQWIGHVLKRLHLLDDGRRKRQADGIVYSVDSAEVIDMMRRYDVPKIQADR